MRSETHKSEGAAEKLGGKLKKNVGRVLGNRRMETEGRAKELKGQARIDAAKTQQRAKGKLEELTGAAKNRVGAVIGNERMQAEGKVRELKGDARQKANR